MPCFESFNIESFHGNGRKRQDRRRQNPKGMATTMTLLLIVDGNAVVGHVGDSRLYLKRDAQAFQLTTDHTLLSEITENFKSVDPASVAKFSHCLTRSVGNNESVAVETLMFEARQNDVLLLCTDGLSRYFENGESVAAMLGGKSVHKIAESLVEFANQSGGGDNVTAVVIRIVDVDDFQLNTRRIQIGSEDTQVVGSRELDRD